MFTIREAVMEDLAPLLELYTHLHDNDVPEFDSRLEKIWDGIITDKNHHVVVGLVDGQIVSSCVVIIVPNLTRSQRPYALVENVVTHKAHRGKGYASQILDYAKRIAGEENCYKIMLMTGSKQDSTLNFYQRAGYNKEDKTAFIQWL